MFSDYSDSMALSSTDPVLFPTALPQVLGSLKCDCREQLQLAMEYIRDHPPGMVIYLQQVRRLLGAESSCSWCSSCSWAAEGLPPASLVL